MMNFFIMEKFYHSPKKCYWLLCLASMVSVCLLFILRHHLLSESEQLGLQLKSLNKAILVISPKVIQSRYQQAALSNRRYQRYRKYYEHSRVVIRRLQDIFKLMPSDIRLNSIAVNDKSWQLSADALNSNAVTVFRQRLLKQTPKNQISLSAMQSNRFHGMSFKVVGSVHETS